MLGRDGQGLRLSDIASTVWGNTSLQCVSENSAVTNVKGNITQVHAWAPLILPADFRPQLILLLSLTVLTLLCQNHPSEYMTLSHQ